MYLTEITRWNVSSNLLKFIYSEKATKFCEIFILLLTVCIVVKSKVKILQNFVAFSEYMNFKSIIVSRQDVIGLLSVKRSRWQRNSLMVNIKEFSWEKQMALPLLSPIQNLILCWIFNHNCFYFP